MTEIEREIEEFLKSWTQDPHGNKAAFLRLKDYLLAKPGVRLGFKARPGITYSLRAVHENQKDKDKDMFVMVDVIDDDPQERWLSVCFYGAMITDPEGKGNFVPQGLLGKDACCFDIEEPNERDIAYVEARLDEAYHAASKS